MGDPGSGGEAKVLALPAWSRLLGDARGGDRFMRATWHEEAGVAVLSLWRQATCIGTVRLDRAQVAALVNVLVDGLAAAPGNEGGARGGS